ncbi:PREDICTED: olfactory receptor 6M1-like [Gekko japonicus]|uniref:Olfactory receptor n=1 Tax=Gekko japonicus TaxID=146911 RepID=A0ABM1K964_GEKJA|nr:PREDICTED: olfactory receptor 6M1-like [Gekko japonicus]
MASSSNSTPLVRCVEERDGGVGGHQLQWSTGGGGGVCLVTELRMSTHHSSNELQANTAPMVVAQSLANTMLQSGVSAQTEIAPRNQSSTTQVTEFILIGFQLPKSVENLFFVMLLAVFLLTLTGNITIITLVCLAQQLQTSMYFFLCNLSLLEILFVLTITPKMLANLVSLNKTISFLGCAAQCYFYFFLGTTEFILIAVMSFDRYVAVCHPLRYAIIVNGRVCMTLVLGCWIGGFLSTIGPIVLFFQLTFCGSNVIDHFFCDYAPMIKLSCNEVQFILALVSILSSVVLLSSLAVTGVSYVYIITTIVRMNSTKGRLKTFSTCASHLTVASIFYGSAIFMYSLPGQGRSLAVQKAVAVLTAVVTPLLNPFIYTLRNEKVKEALRDCLKRQTLKL